MQLNADFGQKLKDLRSTHNLTQQQLATRIGVKKSVISYYEAGTRCPSYEVLKSIARIFAVTADFLLGLERSQSTIDVTGLSAEEIAAVTSVVEVIRKKK